MLVEGDNAAALAQAAQGAVIVKVGLVGAAVATAPVAQAIKAGRCTILGVVMVVVVCTAHVWVFFIVIPPYIPTRGQALWRPRELRKPCQSSLPHSLRRFAH